MLKKIFTLLILCFAVCSTLDAQVTLRHSVGLSGSTMYATLHGRGKQARVHVNSAYITYFPRVSVAINEFSSFSLGLPLGVGMSNINSPHFLMKGSYLAYSIPLVIDYNNAYKAAELGDERVGFYLGAGIDYSATNVDSINYTSTKPKSVGIIIRGGIRLGLNIMERDWGITIGLYHKAGFEEDKLKTVGMNLLFDF